MVLNLAEEGSRIALLDWVIPKTQKTQIEFVQKDKIMGYGH
jgi:hypothetical protein